MGSNSSRIATTAAHRAFPLANRIELVAHLCPQPKRQISWFSHFCEGHCKLLSGMSFALTNIISIASVGFCRAHEYDRQTDRLTEGETNWHTDHATWTATICRIYVHSTAMRPNNNSLNCFNALVTCTQCQNHRMVHSKQDTAQNENSLLQQKKNREL